jgi:hypothetical protein
MTDLFLRFADEAEAQSILYTSVPTEFDEEGNVTAADKRPNYANIDTIGIIYKPTGETLLGEDGEYPEMAPLPGWHVNVRLMPGEDAAPLEPFSVTPAQPVRVWA